MGMDPLTHRRARGIAARRYIVCAANNSKLNPWGTAVTGDSLMTALQHTPHAQLAEIAKSLHEGGGEAPNTMAMSNPELINSIAANAEFHAANVGRPAFGSYFFGITGFHGFHVFSGVDH